ncbi:uncharacterized protein [Amphiura filiformis]|uniref:uncharacterized protein isoform X3 n=1 Tax=Amphiura filiformis TaxID=82378 RepID=UPI003B20D97C
MAMTEKRPLWNVLLPLQLINMFFLWIILANLGITIAEQESELFSCNFEDQCILNQEKNNDEFDWKLQSGTTDQWFTGPSSDHTVGDDTGHYFYAQSDINYFGTTSQLFSPLFNLTKRTARLEFYYHMYDARYPDNMGTLNVYAHPCGVEQLVFSRTGNQGYLWKKAEVVLQCNKEVQIAFEAVRGGTESDIAIDDIKLIDVFDTNPTATQVPYTEEPITESFTRLTPPIGVIVTDPIQWPVGTPPSPALTKSTQKPSATTIPENTSIPTTESKAGVTPKMKTQDNGEEGSPDDGSSTPETTISTAIWGPPNGTLGESTAIIGAAVAVGVMCVLILILIALVWKTRRGKPDGQRRGEMYENQAFNRSQDLQLRDHHFDPSYTALQFSRSRSTASTLTAPVPPKRRYTPSGKYIGLRKPTHLSDSCLSKHCGNSCGISTISTTRSANSNDFGSTMEGSIGIYESVGNGHASCPGSCRRSGRRTPRRVPSEFIGNPVYIGGSENGMEIPSSAKLPPGAKVFIPCTPTGEKLPEGAKDLTSGGSQTGAPLEPKYYTVLPDVVDSLHYKVMHVSGAQTVPCTARTWHISDYCPPSVSEDSDIDVGSKESVYADIDDTKSSLSDYSAGEVNSNIYGPYEIEC